jgi:hypothetical protein
MDEIEKTVFVLTGAVALILSGCVQPPDKAIGCWQLENTRMVIDDNGVFQYPITLQGQYILMPPPGRWERINATAINVTYTLLLPNSAKNGAHGNMLYDAKTDTLYWEGMESKRYTRISCG